MSQPFPAHEETMICPACHAFVAFIAAGGPKPEPFIHLKHIKPDRRATTDHEIRARFCRSCGAPLIQHIAVDRTSGHRQQEVYPIASSRPPAPDEVGKADSDLAKDYDEAVDCEPHSLQAAMLLLGRCVEIILNAKTEAPRKETLGPKIKHAIAQGTIPNDMCDPLEKGFAIARNLAGHEWIDADGKPLKIDKDTLDRCFAIVDGLFMHFYITPQRDKKLVDRMTGTKQKKEAGERSASVGDTAED